MDRVYVTPFRCRLLHNVSDVTSKLSLSLACESIYLINRIQERKILKPQPLTVKLGMCYLPISYLNSSDYINYNCNVFISTNLGLSPHGKNRMGCLNMENVL